MPVTKGAISSMHQVVMKKPVVDYVDHAQYYILTSPTSKDTTAVELINTQNGSAAVGDLSAAVARARSNRMNHLVFRSCTMKALKAGAHGTHRYQNEISIVIPHCRVVSGVGGAVRDIEQLCRS
jgi:hypothetical protein